MLKKVEFMYFNSGMDAQDAPLNGREFCSHAGPTVTPTSSRSKTVTLNSQNSAHILRLLPTRQGAVSESPSPGKKLRKPASEWMTSDAKERCIFDVMATGDLGMATVGAY